MHNGTWKHHLAPAGVSFISWPPSSELLPDEMDCPCCQGGTVKMGDLELAVLDGRGFCMDCFCEIVIDPDLRVLGIQENLKAKGINCHVAIVMKQTDGEWHPSARLSGEEDQMILARPIVQPWINEYAKKWKDLTKR